MPVSKRFVVFGSHWGNDMTYLTSYDTLEEAIEKGQQKFKTYLVIYEYQGWENILGTAGRYERYNLRKVVAPLDSSGSNLCCPKPLPTAWYMHCTYFFR